MYDLDAVSFFFIHLNAKYKQISWFLFLLLERDRQTEAETEAERKERRESIIHVNIVSVPDTDGVFEINSEPRTPR